MGLVAPQHVGSSWTRARTRVPCIGRRVLKHCTTREVLFFFKLCYFGCVGSLLLRRLSPVVASRGYSSLWCAGFSLWSTGSVVVVRGLVAPRYVGSFPTRAVTGVPCIGRRILNHCATKEAQLLF